jgi:hypothetical protein
MVAIFVGLLISSFATLIPIFAMFEAMTQGGKPSPLVR